MRDSRTNQSARYVEIDLLRTVAILMMVFYHLLFDLWIAGRTTIDPLTPGWKFFAHSTASLFLLLVGVSFALRTTHAATQRDLWKGTVRRSIQILLGAAAVTAATFLWDPATYVRFGILHCIGISILVLPILAHLKEWNILLGTLLIAVGNALRRLIVSTSLLLPFGIEPPFFRTLDYYPLLPWAGVIVIGLGLGHLLYIHSVRWRNQFFILNSQFSILCWPGRHSLLLYLIHQPVLKGLITIFV